MMDPSSRRAFFQQTVLAAASVDANRIQARGSEGFFRLAKVRHKWVVLDPQGRPIFLRGLNHYGNGAHMPLNLKARYGTSESWRRAVRDRHREWGFNYLPPSIGPSEIAADAVAPVVDEDGSPRWPAQFRRTPEWPAQHFAELNFPFTAFLEVPRQNMSDGGMPDVFSREFRDLVDKRCREFVAPLKDNPNLVGYHFTHNPPWHFTNPGFRRSIVDLVSKSQPAKSEWARLMQRIYGSVERWRRTYGIPIQSFEEIERVQFPLYGYVSKANEIRDLIAFMRRVCNKWYKVYTDTVRKYDPNHLILGDRNTTHLSPLADFAVYIMAKYVDFVSINAMGPKDVVYELMEQITLYWDGPILLGDTGAGIYNGRHPKSGYMCRDLAEYEELYSSLMEAGLSHPQLIGFGWCGYYETPSARSGLVDSRNDEPLADRVEVVKKYNRWMEERFSLSVMGQ